MVDHLNELYGHVWIALGIATLMFFAVAFALHKSCIVQPHDWEWQHNTWNNVWGKPQVFGMYRCRRCFEYRTGCARHEQSTRELDNESQLSR